MSMLWMLVACGGSGSFSAEREVCDEYLQCVGDTDPSAVGDAIAAYGEDSDCWDNEDQADLCADACEEGIASVRACSGGGTVCDDFVDYLVDDCGFEPATTTGTAATDFDCSDGTEVACESACGLAADCSVFVDPGDPAWLAELEAYADCVSAC